MPRERSPSRDKAFEIYKKHNGNINLVEIAKQLNLSDGTVRGWKNKDKWDSKLNGTLQKNTERSNKKKNNINKESKLEAITEVDSPELTDKQRLFCMYYVKYRNKTKAYMKAYKCSYENACAHAYELWKNVVVRNEIDKQLKELRDEIKLDAQDLIQKHIDIAFADITDFLIFGQEEVPVINAFGPVLDEEGNPVTKMMNTVKFRTWTNVDGTLISEISQGRDGAKIKLYDKMKALDWLANHMDLLDTATQRKLELEKEKVQIARENLELGKSKASGGNGDTNKEGIEEFIKATTMSESDIKELFKDAVDE